MSLPLAKSAQSVQQALHDKGIEATVLELPNSTRTAQDAANAVGCDIAQIVKSLIFKTAQTNRPVLVLASGPNRVNEQKIADLIGEPITKADANFVREITGFAIGGIPPLGHKHTIDLIYIDEDLLQYPEIWAAAGTPNAVFNLQSKYLSEIIAGEFINLR